MNMRKVHFPNFMEMFHRRSYVSQLNRAEKIIVSVSARAEVGWIRRACSLKETVSVSVSARAEVGWIRDDPHIKKFAKSPSVLEQRWGGYRMRIKRIDLTCLRQCSSRGGVDTSRTRETSGAWSPSVLEQRWGGYQTREHILLARSPSVLEQRWGGYVSRLFLKISSVSVSARAEVGWIHPGPARAQWRTVSVSARAEVGWIQDANALAHLFQSSVRSRSFFPSEALTGFFF